VIVRPPLNNQMVDELPERAVAFQNTHPFATAVGSHSAERGIEPSDFHRISNDVGCNCKGGRPHHCLWCPTLSAFCGLRDWLQAAETTLNEARSTLWPQTKRTAIDL